MGAPGTISGGAASVVVGVFASVLSNLAATAKAGLADACLRSVFGHARRRDMVDGGECAEERVAGRGSYRLYAPVCA